MSSKLRPVALLRCTWLQTKVAHETTQCQNSDEKDDASPLTFLSWQCSGSALTARGISNTDVKQTHENEKDVWSSPSSRTRFLMLRLHVGKPGYEHKTITLCRWCTTDPSTENSRLTLAQGHWTANAQQSFMESGVEWDTFPD
jgi:hypothetical protein